MAALSATASAAVVTNAFVQNRPQNITQSGGVTASQSTTAFGGDAARAIDGNTNGNWAGNSVTHTDPLDVVPFWQVDFHLDSCGVMGSFLKDMTEPWPFDQPPHCATFTTSHVMVGGHLVTHVYHDEDDHGWQFHYAGEKSEADAMLVALKEIVELDDTLLQLADLPPGWMASRTSKDDPWKRSRVDECLPD